MHHGNAEAILTFTVLGAFGEILQGVFLLLITPLGKVPLPPSKIQLNEIITESETD